MKNVEFFSLPPGSFFNFEWKGNELSYYYTNFLEIEYIKYNCKQSFFSRLLYGKLSQTISVPIPKYGTEFNWRNVEGLQDLNIRSSIVDISDFIEYGIFNKNDREALLTKKHYTKNIDNKFNNIIENCPVDNVVVFGYDLKIKDNKIIPTVIQSSVTKNKTIECKMFLQCGFAGY